MRSLSIQKQSAIEELVTNFYNLRGQILIAVRNEEGDLIYALDRELQNHWKSLLEVLPDRRIDQLELIDFFLDQIIEHPDSCQITLASKNRILFLSEYQY